MLWIKFPCGLESDSNQKILQIKRFSKITCNTLTKIQILPNSLFWANESTKWKYMPRALYWCIVSLVILSFDHDMAGTKYRWQCRAVVMINENYVSSPFEPSLLGPMVHLSQVWWVNMKPRHSTRASIHTFNHNKRPYIGGFIALNAQIFWFEVIPFSSSADRYRWSSISRVQHEIFKN